MLHTNLSSFQVCVPLVMNIVSVIFGGEVNGIFVRLQPVLLQPISQDLRRHLSCPLSLQLPRTFGRKSVRFFRHGGKKAPSRPWWRAGGSRSKSCAVAHASDVRTWSNLEAMKKSKLDFILFFLMKGNSTLTGWDRVLHSENRTFRCSCEFSPASRSPAVSGDSLCPCVCACVWC